MVWGSNARRATAGLMCMGLALSGGCNGWPVGYIPLVMLGEVGFLARGVPIEFALHDRSLTQEERDKLAFLIRARDYCRDVIGLRVGNNFRTFVNLRGRTLAWNLTASRKDAIEAYEWFLPLVGPIPYLGFFNLDRAKAERDRLARAGYDTFIYEVDAFAIPLLPDPVTSRLLERPYGDLADTVAHELTHNTVMTMEDVTYSESLAMFVGRTVAIEFLTVEFGEDSPLIQELLDQYEDDALLRTYLDELIDELTALYESDLSSEEKIAQRRPILEAWRDRFASEALPAMHYPENYEVFGETLLNNAFLLVSKRYNSDQTVFEQVFEMTGRSWPRALDLFRHASTADDPFQYLRDMLDGNGS